MTLLGEHAVSYGRPALAAGLDLAVEVQVNAGAGPPGLETDRPELAGDGRLARLLAGAAASLGLEPAGFDVRVRSDVAPSIGLGSSAALVVALLRALAAAAGRRLTPEVEFALGRRLEKIFHHSGNGIDPAAAAFGSCFRFVRGEPPAVTRVPSARPLSLVLALSRGRRSAATTIEALRTRWEVERPRYERLFDEIAAVVDEGARAIEAGDMGGVGHAFDRNHDLLRALGMSGPDVEQLVGAARGAGALGAKLTGGQVNGVLARKGPRAGRGIPAPARRRAHRRARRRSASDSCCRSPVADSASVRVTIRLGEPNGSRSPRPRAPRSAAAPRFGCARLAWFRSTRARARGR